VEKRTAYGSEVNLVITVLITRTTFHSSLTTRSLCKKSNIISGISTVILKFVGKTCVNIMKILNSTLLSFYLVMFVFDILN